MKTDIAELLIQLVNMCTDLYITIAYAQTALRDIEIPAKERWLLEQNLFKYQLLENKYGNILRKNKKDPDYYQKVFNGYNSLEEDSSFMREFLFQLDSCLILFSDGPKFQKGKLMYHLQLEI